MNYLKNKTVYLCGPMHTPLDEGVAWRDEITPLLSSFGITVSDPTKTVISEIGEDKKNFRDIILTENWEKLKVDFWPIVRKDLRSVDKSDFLIFNYMAKEPSVGTWHELLVATAQKKPILMKYDRKELPKFNPWVATFIKNGHFFHSWADMISYLITVDSGVFDTSYWTL